MLTTNLVGTAKHIKSPRDARHALGLSQSQMGKLLGHYHPNGREGRPYTAGAISQWENHIFTMNEDVRTAYRLALDAAVLKMTGDKIWAEVYFFGKWAMRVRLWTLCDSCHRKFQPISRRNRLCERCR